MTEQKRIRIVSNGRAGMAGDTQVFIDGVDVTNSVTHVAWSLGVDYVSRATITFAPAELEVEYVAEVRETSATVVPAEYFDQLVADLDAPDEPNEPTREAARRLHGIRAEGGLLFEAARVASRMGDRDPSARRARRRQPDLTP